MLKLEKNIEISRKYKFSSGEKSALSKLGSGSDWSLEVSIKGPLDPKTQLVFNLIDLDDIVLPVIGLIDKKNLNIEIESFKNKMIEPEDLAEYLFQKINQELKIRHGDLELVKTKVFRMGSEQWGSYTKIKDTEDL